MGSFDQTQTEIRRTYSESDSIAPNGSSRSHDYYTVIVKRQHWHNTPRNGIYAGLDYKITETWISTRGPGHLDTCIGRTSQPWTDDE
ncbi:hypothetical protein [Saccharopolyspora mangrovi]|uniref:Uncharacterized protein n=1 Tax=Saccharopolyspora mangrovi TaxID=3082379 RepID=A0ABU6A793_9PSEU|nr:hypothetical protein [Saccharopolyspora sp. S2-29]MEB3367433.1 hypothetical protein [Saccharopolyspora sp. S2-29]